MLDPALPNAILTNSVLAILAALVFAIYTLTWQFLKVNDNPPRGCRKLGLSSGKSNLDDEYDPKYTQGVPEDSIDSQGHPAWRVKALFTYPLKSCTGIELDETDIVATGFAYDRQFCFAEADSSAVDGEVNWTARTLRNRGFNKLALVRPEIWIPDLSVPGYSPTLDEVKLQGVMVIKYPRVGRNALHSAIIKTGILFGLITHETSFTVPLYPPNAPGQAKYIPLTRVKIWKDNPLTYNYGYYIPPSFHRFITQEAPTPTQSQGRTGSQRLTLFRVNPSHTREIYRNAPRKADLGFQPTTGFADAYPLHILGLSSVRDVNAHCKSEVPYLSVRRFRANVIVQGPGAFVEDDWKVIRIEPANPSSVNSSVEKDGRGSNLENSDGVTIYTACRTIRCKLPNVDPDTGIRHRSEPDRTLKAYRRIDKGDLTNACLGMQGVPAVQYSRIRVGDRISVLETGEHCYIKMLAPGEVVEGV
ncbi:hypothetical protein BDV18DRAFT_44055 [Aspergillus unguis]